MVTLSDIKLGGKTIPKPALIAAMAAGVGILGYAYWNRRMSSSAATPATTLDAGIDPTTGLPYADEFGYMQQGGGGAPQQGATGAGYYDPVTGQFIGTGVGNQVVQSVSTNGAWYQAAMAYLVNVAQFDPSTVAAALGNGLHGAYMTADQLGIWSAATGSQGEPPQGHPPLVTTPPGGQGTTPGNTGQGPVTGLHTTGIGKNRVSLDWAPVSGTNIYAVDVNGSRKSTSYHSGSIVSGLKPNTSYTIGVTPVKKDQSFGTRASISVRTKK